ncbi:MAG: hypothetical protein WCL16_05700 [bacterium]
MRALLQQSLAIAGKLLKTLTTAWSGLSKPEQRLLNELAAGRPVAALVLTGTTVDVGSWFKKGRVVGVWVGGEWTMFAAGQRPFVEKVSPRLLAASVYNHIIGKLVLAPAPEVRLRQLRMSPLDAVRALRWILN